MSRVVLILVLLAPVALACQPSSVGPSDAGVAPDAPKSGANKRSFLQKVHTFTPAKGASFGHEDFPKNIQGPPRGLGKAKGSLDVVSLGCGGSIVLEFSDPWIHNGPGPDFIVFENAFHPGGGSETFAEPAQVSVSVDGETWKSFPCAPEKWPYAQCAGVRPVFSHPDNAADPHDPKAAGGDAFDLEELGMSKARFVKIEDLSHRSPDASIWCGSHNAGFDLDALVVLWGRAP